MPKFARVEDGLVREIFQEEPVLVAELMAQLVEIPNGLDVQANWTYDGNAFDEPEPLVLPFEEQIRLAFSSLSIPLQSKYRNEIRDAAFFLERENLPMVLVVIQEAAEKVVLPAEQEVQDIIDLATAVLGGI